jgi:hypothetical protein
LTDELEDVGEAVTTANGPITVLDDLPPHRRDALLWRYALVLDYDGSTTW